MTMPSSYLCVDCRHTFRMRLRQLYLCGQHFPRNRTTILFSGTKHFLSSKSPFRTVQPQAYQKTEKKLTNEAPKSSPSTQFSPIQSVAKQLRKRATVTTETYIAYGVCEKLVEKCASQASYRIPQAQDKNVDIPKMKNGEDLGVGEGWWYQSMLNNQNSSQSPTNRYYSPRSSTNVQHLGSSNLFAYVYAHLPSPHVPAAVRSNLAPTST